MIGAMYRLGEQKVRPGVYVRYFNDGDLPTYAGAIGVAAAVIKTNWGPLGQVIKIEKAEDVHKKIGVGYGSDVVSEMFKGGAYTVLAVRVGLGGNHGEVILKDTEGLEALSVKTKFPSSREFTVTVRDSLNEGEREFLVFEANRQVERILFSKGENEPKSLATAINERSAYFQATVSDGGGTTIGPVVNEKVTGGSDPDTTAQDYTDAFSYIEREFFDVITVDTEDSAIHAGLQAFVNRKLQEGFRFIGVVGEKTEVPFNTRKENARAFNSFAMVYVGNGYSTPTGDLDGALAAGRVAGMMISNNYKTSLTKKSVQGSTGVYGELTSTEYNEAVKSGMLVFSLNPEGLAQIDYGINTLVSPTGDEDDGWKKIRRVRTRFELIDRVAFTLDRAIGTGDGIPNSNDGRQFVITVANGIINDMIREGGLESGELVVDTDNPPRGDSAWFRFQDLVDLDGIEKLYLAFGFKY